MSKYLRTLWPKVVFVCFITLSHYHNYADFSESIEHRNAFHVYSFKWARLTPFSQLSFMQYMGLRHQPLFWWYALFIVLWHILMYFSQTLPVVDLYFALLILYFNSIIKCKLYFYQINLCENVYLIWIHLWHNNTTDFLKKDCIANIINKLPSFIYKNMVTVCLF